MNVSPTILIDTREQHPWVFSNLPSEPGSLPTGDYSVRGLEHLIAIERKSLDDLLACCGRERSRFLRELARLRGFRFRALIVEANYSDLEAGEWRSQLKSSHVLGSLAAWQCQFSLPIWLAGDHESAARFAEKYLFQCARLIASENAAVGLTEECGV